MSISGKAAHVIFKRKESLQRPIHQQAVSLGDTTAGPSDVGAGSPGMAGTSEKSMRNEKYR
jgi:hypothetical protein